MTSELVQAMRHHYSRLRLIGQQLRIARERQQLTQQQVATKMGVPYQQIQAYERGQKLTLERMLVLADLLKINGPLNAAITEFAARIKKK